MKPYYVLFIGIFVGIISILIINNTCCLPSYETFEIDNMPISIKPINETMLTALIMNTQQENNETILHLSNGFNLIDKSNSLQSGNVLSLNLTSFKYLCVNTINTTPENQTFNKVLIKNDPKCEPNFIGYKLNEWHKVS